MADRDTCRACGHEDWCAELYSQATPEGVHRYCRNHNTCHARVKAKYVTNHRKQEPVMEFGTYEEPAQVEGDTYKPRENYGHSAIVRVSEYKESVVTSNSPKGAPAVIIDVYDLNNKRAYLDVLIMTGALVDGFKPHVDGHPIVIKWEKAVAGNGRDYAKAVPAVAAAIEAAKAVYATGDPFSGSIQAVIDEEMPF